jgi:hypothetical protein
LRPMTVPNRPLIAGAPVTTERRLSTTGCAGEDQGAAHDAVSQLIGSLYRAEDDDEVMILLGQAQGMIMAARDTTALEALLELSTRAAKDGTELGTAAQAIVRDARRGAE